MVTNHSLCLYTHWKRDDFDFWKTKKKQNQASNNKWGHFDLAYFKNKGIETHITMVSCQKGPTRHAYSWQIGPFWQDTLDNWGLYIYNVYTK